MAYDYINSMVEDINQIWLDGDQYRHGSWSDCDTFDQLIDQMYDDLFIDDSVTGNASGSYTFNSYEARECVYGNEDLFEDAAAEFGLNAETIARHIFDYEWIDVTIRCSLLSQALREWEDRYDIESQFNEMIAQRDEEEAE